MSDSTKDPRPNAPRPDAAPSSGPPSEKDIERALLAELEGGPIAGDAEAEEGDPAAWREQPEEQRQLRAGIAGPGAQLRQIALRHAEQPLELPQTAHVPQRRDRQLRSLPQLRHI